LLALANKISSAEEEDEIDELIVLKRPPGGAWLLLLLGVRGERLRGVGLGVIFGLAESPVIPTGLEER
jgi:hypothetical protein